jgi:hypothetical protein
VNNPSLNTPMCGCNVMESSTCESCKSKANDIQKFLENSSNQVKNNSLWQNVEKEELEMAAKQIERSIMTALYDL